MFTAASDRDECLIDRSIEETFPASDSTSPAMPGSLLSARYAARPHRPGRWRRTAAWPGVLAALICGALVAITLARKR